MLTKHYVELNPRTMDEIIAFTHADPKALEETYMESLTMGMPYYILFDRYPNGLPDWRCYSQVELAVEFRLERIDPRSATTFVKL